MIYKKNVIVLMLFMSISIFSYAQVRKDARLLYNQLYPVSVNFGYHVDEIQDRLKDQRIFHEIQNELPIAIGLDYNFAQTGRFNFKVGVYAKRFAYSSQIRIDGSTVGTQDDLNIERSLERLWTIQTPITIEYIRRINENIYLSFYTGYEFQYYNYMENDSEELIFVDGIDKVRLLKGDNPTYVFGGMHLGIGAYIRFDNETFLKLDLTFQTRNVRTFQRVDVLEDSTNEIITSEISINNSHTALTLRFAPPHRWFSKKPRYKRGI